MTCPDFVAFCAAGHGTLDAGGGHPFTPEAVAGPTGMEADAIRALVRDFAGARTAACYGRMGTCVQDHGAASSWLVDALNLVTGNLDRKGARCSPRPRSISAGWRSGSGRRGAWGDGGAA